MSLCGDVRLRLIVVVVADEVLDGILRKQPPKLLVELGRQGFVVRDHQHRLVHRGENLSDGEGLAGSGHPEQALLLYTVAEPGRELFDRGRLVASWAQMG